MTKRGGRYTLRCHGGSLTPNALFCPLLCVFFSLGTQNLIFSRPQFYQLLLGRIPAHRISLGKKVLRTVEKEGRIRIHCSDNSTHETDILIGADGAYSSVRQSMFKRMEAEDRLPKCDTENLAVASINMVGVAVPEDLSKYPQLKDPFSHFSVVIGGSGSRSVSGPKRTQLSG